MTCQHLHHIFHDHIIIVPLIIKKGNFADGRLKVMKTIALTILRANHSVCRIHYRSIH
jgi:hypothetical protein